MKFNIIFIVFLAPFAIAKAQQKDSLQLSSSVTCICQNFKKEIFLGLESGDIVKLDENGSLTQQFSYPNMSSVTSITCANPLKVMAFYRDNQNYLFLERFNSQPRMYEFSPDRRIEFATLAPDQSFWLITTNDLQLVRMDIIGSEAILYQLSNVLSGNDVLLDLINYENGIAILTNQHFFQFNLAGQLIHTYPLVSGSNTYEINGKVYAKNLDTFSVSVPGNSKVNSIPTFGDTDYVIEMESGNILIKKNLVYYKFR
jgi:hypothetical protein